MRVWVAWVGALCLAGLAGSACVEDPTQRETNPPAGAGARGAPLAAARTHFANVPLVTHEGKTVRFYDDLIKGKIVAINFMYATCTER